ncbi:MAG: EAL domain-containing protein [Gammaproteobacteria bacterium]|nr:EAL domain-containing protein [Gammaproteobacteria bacterium]
MPANQQTSAEVIDLRKSLRNREAEIELLQETFEQVGSELELEKVFQIVAERAHQLVQAETILIPILDDDCETYTYRGGSGKNASEIVGESLPINFGVCGWVWRHKKAWWRGILDELNEEERNLWEQEAGTVILVPLQGKKHFLGGIAGINKIGGGEFDRRDMVLLSLFASIVAIAIENAMAVQRIEYANQTNEKNQHRLERLNRQLMESSRELEQLSLYDPVTSLPNRSLFHDRLNQNISVAQKNNQHIGVLLVDLNNFKGINETLGHEQGDQLLKEFAQRLLSILNPDETISRLGGDEFGLILPKSDAKKTLARGRKLLQLLDDYFVIDHAEITIGACIGACIYPDHGDDIANLLRRADNAMHNAKRQKRDIFLYDPEEDHSSMRQLTMATDLRKAFDENQFELFYQPKINMADDSLIGVEALGRWKHPLRGYIPPAIFIPNLEQLGMIDRFTYKAIELALDQISQWEQQGYNIKVAINLSTQTLMNPEFILHLKDIIKNPATGEKLLFEITENLFLSEYDRLSETLAFIRDLGIHLSIDDFGTGYSSLSRLKKLPVSELKIDQSFVTDMIDDADDKVIVKSTIELAHNLGLNVVAEGIETEDVYKKLKLMGCDIAQGYFISKPIPSNEFDQFLQQQNISS